MAWFDSIGLELLVSSPKTTAFDPFLPNEKLFEKHPKGSRFEHFLVQTGMLCSPGPRRFRSGAILPVHSALHETKTITLL